MWEHEANGFSNQKKGFRNHPLQFRGIVREVGAVTQPVACDDRHKNWLIPREVIQDETNAARSTRFVGGISARSVRLVAKARRLQDECSKVKRKDNSEVMSEQEAGQIV
jgi:hypothetical protein